MFCPKCGVEYPDNSKFCRGCGSNLTGVLAVAEGDLALTDSGDDVEIASMFSSALRNIILGLGFIVISIFMKTMPGDTYWWLGFVIAGVSLLATGIPRYMKAESLKGMRGKKVIVNRSIEGNQTPSALPPTQQQYIGPVSNVVTNDLVVPSVTEETTRHLKK